MAVKTPFQEYIVERGLVADEVLTKLFGRLKKGQSIESVLIEQGAVDENALYSAKAEFLSLPLFEGADKRISEEALQFVSAEAVEHYRFIPLAVDQKEKRLDVGMLNPENIDAQEALKFIALRARLEPHIFLLKPSDFEELLKQYRTLRGEVAEALEELEEEMEGRRTKEGAAAKAEKKEEVAEDAPITRMVEVILNHAIEAGASDIHIEPMAKELRVRFRVDGVLHTSLTLPKQVHSAVVSRIKILSNLKIDVTRKPQDGRFPTKVGNKQIDLRVSTFPTSDGEKVVMRILDPDVGLLGFKELGIEGHNVNLLQDAIKRPFGMILVTGPTGSGKSTTLYSILSVVNEEGVNIVSLEDPVEYKIAGIAQSQVQPEIGYTFASGLRHILRQDPDKIMVGEIRDAETAELAIHAALTGHLVLSTLHTNDALGVIPRLIDMGVDKYLLPSTIILMVAQRLVRRLCPDSKEEVQISDEQMRIVQGELASLSEDDKKRLPDGGKSLRFYKPVPSKDCPKGTSGRIGIYEMVHMSRQLENIILENPSESLIEDEAKRQKMTTMKQDGIIKALQGLVGIEEVFRAVELDIDTESSPEGASKEPSERKNPSVA